MLKIFADALLIAARMDAPRYEDSHRQHLRDAEARRVREQMLLTNVRF